MKKLLLTVCAVLLLGGAAARAQKWDGLAQTPQMGWNAWNCFQCNIDEDRIKSIADMLVRTGLADAGYVYLNLDDGWHGQRDSLGFIHEDPAKFPSGLKALADYVHGKGLKLGIYSDAGRKTCAGYPGSFGHEYQDAISYASWGIDYLKYDWCRSENINPKGAYALMRDALRSAGRPILFSMCEWGQSKPWEWAEEVGHSWRSTGDIGPSFEDPETQYDANGNPIWHPLGILTILDSNEPLREAAGPGHWNDPDMLEVGNGMSLAEDRAHFSLWCMMAAPLLLGNDLTRMSEETLGILTNRDVIAVDQDRLGIQGYRAKTAGGVEYWYKPLEGGDWALCLFNRGEEEATVTLNWMALETQDAFSGRRTNFAQTTCTVKDLWNSDAPVRETRVRGTGKNRKLWLPVNWTVTIPSHDVVMYRISEK